MEDIRKAFHAKADAEFALYQLTMEHQTKRKLNVPEDWTCPGNVKAGTACPTNASIPFERYVNFNNQKTYLCAACYKAYKKKAFIKKHKPTDPKEEEQEEEEEEIN